MMVLGLDSIVKLPSKRYVLVTEKMPMSEMRKLLIKLCHILETKQDSPQSLKVLSTQGKNPFSFYFTKD